MNRALRCLKCGKEIDEEYLQRYPNTLVCQRCAEDVRTWLNVNVYDFTRRTMGQILKSRRKQLQLSQRALADMTGLRQSKISNIEMGQFDIQSNTLFKILEALRLKIVFQPNKNKKIIERRF